MIPGMANPQAWNRYSYVYNNPVLYNDPTGHFAILGVFIPPLLVAVAVGALALATCNAISPCHDAMVDGISNARDNFSQMAKGYNKTPGREIPKYNPENSFFGTEGQDPGLSLGKYIRDFCNKVGWVKCGSAVIMMTAAVVCAGLEGFTDNNCTRALSAKQTELIQDSTSTPTLTPPNTSTNTPSCPPPFAQCPNTSTPPANNTSTPPVSTPTPPPIFTPAPPNPGGPHIPV